MPRKNPLAEVYAMLEERDDIALGESTADRIQGSQLRRHWCVTTTNAGGFNPVTVEHWGYFGQFFMIMERRTKRDGELVAELANVCADMGRLGVWVILIDPEEPLDAVIDRLGSVPEDFKDYLARKPK